MSAKGEVKGIIVRDFRIICGSSVQLSFRRVSAENVFFFA